MSNLLLLKCTKDTEGWWTEGEVYPARVVAGGFVLVGEDGSVVYQVGGVDGEVLFEESAQ